MQQRVDHRVAGDEDPGRVLALGDQVLARLGGGGEMPGGDIAGDQPVQLLGEGAVDIVTAQPRLDMGHRNALVERRQCRGHGGGGVALHHDDVGLRLVEHLGHAEQHLGGYVEQRLARRHDIEIVIHRHAGQRDHLVDHLAVLGGDADLGVEMRALQRRLRHGEAFQGLRTGAEDDEQPLPPGTLGRRMKVHIAPHCKVFACDLRVMQLISRHCPAVALTLKL